jgi:type VI secretion system protein ImpA
LSPFERVVGVPTLSVDEFLGEVPGDNPAGDPVPFQVKAELEEARKEIDPDSYDPADPARPTEAKDADWSGIIARAGQTLKETSKDLLVAARLTEALTRVHGFDGLADGLAVLRGMIDRCWDRMHPEIEDGDLEARAGPFHWLSDADRGALFPHAVRNVPLITSDGVGIGWQQWRGTQDGQGAITREDFEKAVAAAPRETCKTTFEALTRCVAELNSLTESLNGRLGTDSPGMTDLRAAVGDCYSLAKQILDRKGKDPEESEGTSEDAATGESESAATGDGRSGGRAVLTRADVYRRLAEAAELLERIEPHSPIPYLIRKAVELGGLPFPQLMRALIRDDNVLQEMNRELGIKEPTEG